MSPECLSKSTRRFHQAQPTPPSLRDDIRVAFKEWRVPTSGSHPHDPLATRDGAIWYTGQMANLLGRLDPKTGQFREYRLKTANSGPHGLVSDANGAIWFTASFKGYIGKLDPVSGDIREFALPDRKARDPHTPVFDQRGVSVVHCDRREYDRTSRSGERRD